MRFRSTPGSPSGFGVMVAAPAPTGPGACPPWAASTADVADNRGSGGRLGLESPVAKVIVDWYCKRSQQQYIASSKPSQVGSLSTEPYCLAPLAGSFVPGRGRLLQGLRRPRCSGRRTAFSVRIVPPGTILARLGAGCSKRALMALKAVSPLWTQVGWFKSVQRGFKGDDSDDQLQ